jgi:protein TonB
MFEDSTFESTGRIRTRSRGWMIAAFAFNGSILLTMILIPLIYPEALPRLNQLILMEAPPPPMERPKPQPQVEHATVVRPQFDNGTLTAPPRIPVHTFMPRGPEILAQVDTGDWGTPGGVPGADNAFHSRNTPTVVAAPPKGPVRLSSKMVEGMLIDKIVPIYPAIAKAAGVQGTIVLQATISKNGTIENLRVVSGNPMLQQAALDAVKNWRYRPYMLNGETIEVETTVNVVFTLAR